MFVDCFSAVMTVSVQYCHRYMNSTVNEFPYNLRQQSLVLFLTGVRLSGNERMYCNGGWANRTAGVCVCCSLESACVLLNKKMLWLLTADHSSTAEMIMMDACT